MGKDKILIQEKALKKMEGKSPYGKRSTGLLKQASYTVDKINVPTAGSDDVADQIGPDARQRKEDTIIDYRKEVMLLMQQGRRTFEPGMGTLEAVQEHRRCVEAYINKITQRQQQLERQHSQMQGQRVPVVGITDTHEKSSCQSCISDENDVASTS